LRILLDECTPRVVKTRLAHRTISTVQEMGWTGITNGALLARADREFDVLVTADRSLRYQQNLAGRRLAVVVLPTNRVPAVILVSAHDRFRANAALRGFQTEPESR
jgi:hypothetical protein